MLVDVMKALAETVTVVCRVDAEDAGADEDEYHARVLAGCNWQAQATRSVDTDGTVSVGRTTKVQVPASAGEFSREFAGQADRWSAKSGDVVVRGRLEGGPFTRSELLKALKGREWVTVKAVTDLRGNGGVRPGSGVTSFAAIVLVEGV